MNFISISDKFHSRTPSCTGVYASQVKNTNMPLIQTAQQRDLSLNSTRTNVSPKRFTQEFFPQGFRFHDTSLFTATLKRQRHNKSLQRQYEKTLKLAQQFERDQRRQQLLDYYQVNYDIKLSPIQQQQLDSQRLRTPGAQLIMQKRLQLKQQRNAVVKIQMTVRRFIAQKKFIGLQIRRKQAALTIQRFLRKILLIFKQRRAALVIQKFVRAKRSTVELKKARAQLRIEHCYEYFREIQLKLQNEAQIKIRRGWVQSRKRSKAQNQINTRRENVEATETTDEQEYAQSSQPSMKTTGGVIKQFKRHKTVNHN